MTATRVLRSPMQADDRIRLGVQQYVTPAVAAAAPQIAAAILDPSQQVIEERSRRIEQLEARLTDVQQERDQLRTALAGLEEQISAARSAALQHGHAEGLKSGEAQAQREVAGRIAEWQQTIEQSTRRYESALQTIQSELSDVVMAAIAKLLGDHAINPPLVRAAIEQTLREAGIGVPARVLLAPSQYEQLTRFGASHLAALRERRIEIAPDPRITAGGCMLENANGLVDGRFEVQLKRLKDIVAGHFAAGSVAK